MWPAENQNPHILLWKKKAAGNIKPHTFAFNTAWELKPIMWTWHLLMGCSKKLRLCFNRKQHSELMPQPMVFSLLPSKGVSRVAIPAEAPRMRASFHRHLCAVVSSDSRTQKQILWNSASGRQANYVNHTQTFILLSGLVPWPSPWHCNLKSDLRRLHITRHP